MDDNELTELARLAVKAAGAATSAGGVVGLGHPAPIPEAQLLHFENAALAVVAYVEQQLPNEDLLSAYERAINDPHNPHVEDLFAEIDRRDLTMKIDRPR